MPPQAPRTSARLLAPIALVVAVIALVMVIGSSGSGGGGDNSGDKAGTTDKTVAAPKSTPKSKAKVSTYTVKTGDTLGSIAVKSGVSVETLQELNPDVDPQALVSGQKIKLRE